MTTFVTAFLDLDEDRTKDKSFDTCFNLFEQLVSTEISLHLFISPSLADRITPRKNVKVEQVTLTDLFTYDEYKEVENVSLPERRTVHHDTSHFLVLMNAKIEFMEKAIRANHFPSTHYAWIDFSIFHVLHDKEKSTAYLQLLHQTALKDKLLAFPGCWQKGYGADTLFHQINWRFCGGFFIGDTTSILNMYKLMRSVFPELVRTKGLTWEVNVWHYLELYHGLDIQWFSANHNDSIIRLPQTFFKCVASLTTIPSRIDNDCKLAIDSLLHQVDHIYLSVSTTYRRFGPFPEDAVPMYLEAYPYNEKVTLVRGEDYGPASKYIGAVDSLPEQTFVFCCDDDQEYHDTLIERMKQQIVKMAVYQNHYHPIRAKTSGGLIHGYVGNLIHTSVLKSLRTFPLPEAARFVDDQWTSLFCKIHDIPILPSGVEEYKDIFKVLMNGYEKYGTVDSLSALHNRREKIKELEEFFNVFFEDKKC